jgi:SAM-dependent methyltransferase
LRSSKKGKVTLLGGDKLSRALAENDAPCAKIESNNREKNYILSGNEPFLKLLDVSDESGRVRDKRQSKFRQINRFLELIRDCLSHLPSEGTLRICDLCCGKSYLSFAAYHYFTVVLGRDVKMTGVDLKPDVVAYCNEVAKKLNFNGLEFLHGDVNKYECDEHVHLVISLHACDTATDLVLEKAMEWGADVVLSTPCCHHELNHTLNCPALSFVAEHSMLRQKLCDAATDALRLKLLESRGYAVCALELIDPEETPKNIMLRALRKPGFDTASREAERLREEYSAARAFLLGQN